MMPTDGPEHRPNSGGRSGQRVTIQVCRNRPPSFVDKLECMCENPKNFACGAPPGGLAAPLSLDAVRKILLRGALRHRKDAGQNLAYPPTNGVRYVDRLRSAVGCKPREAVLYPDTVAGADPRVGPY